LTEQYYRPSIVATRGEEFTRGSCRSIPEFHITHALDECAELLVRHGGHSAAAGFTVENDNLPELIERLKAIAARQLANQDLRHRLKVDALVSLADLPAGLFNDLAMLQPHGMENPVPLLVTNGLKVVDSKLVGKDGTHLKLTVSDGYKSFPAIAFRQGHWKANMPKFVNLAYNLETNEYNGFVSLQLNVRDIQKASI
jgi:single-stranded-DNA-specific exonuclease